MKARVVEKILGICLRGFEVDFFLKKISGYPGDFVVISMDAFWQIISLFR
jgi:hypothetical protein